MPGRAQDQTHTRAGTHTSCTSQRPSIRNFNPTSPLGARVLAILLVASLLSPLSLPALGGSTPFGNPLDAPHSGESKPIPDWPPAAWNEGDITNLTLLQMTLLLGGAEPATPAEQEAHEQLARLDDLPPHYEQVARTTLEGLTRAFWHQYQAIRDLPPDQQRSLLAAAQGDSTDPGLGAALDAMDTAQVLQAAAVLMQTAQDIERVLDALPRDPLKPGLADTLAPHLHPNATTPEPHPHVEDLESLDILATRLSGIDPKSPEAAELTAALENAPPAGVEAIHRILAALDRIPLEATDSPERDEALFTLAEVVDAEYETLRIWSGMATARAIHESQTEPPFRFLDPNAERPSLRMGLPGDHWNRDPPAPHPRSLSESLSLLADTLGDSTTTEHAKSLTEPVERATTPQQQDALSRLLSAIATHTHQSHIAQATPVPQTLREDPALLGRWAHQLDEGELPGPGTPEATKVLEVADYLQIQKRAESALEELLAAAEEIVPAFHASASSPSPFSPTNDNGNGVLGDDPQEGCEEDLPGSLQDACDALLDDHDLEQLCESAPSALQEPCEEGPPDATGQVCGQAPSEVQAVCDSLPDEHTLAEACEVDPRLEQYVVAPYFALDLCGTDTVWEDEHQTMVTIDVGGDDTYLHSAGAPFDSRIKFSIEVEDVQVGGEEVGEGVDFPVTLPVSLLFDLDGNDTYDSQGRDCAQGAACAQGSVSVLVDWTGDHADQRNTFIAENRSQGYGVAMGYAMMLERAGMNSSLDSEYSAKNLSQGVSSPLDSNFGISAGVLARLVGDGSHSRANFIARNMSQGAADRINNDFNLPPTAVFYSGIGAFVQAEHGYSAGMRSQGAVSSPSVLVFEDFLALPGFRDVPAYAVFASLAGPGSQSNDTYHAEDKSRGWAPVTDIEGGVPPVDVLPTAYFIDALALQTLDPGEAARIEEGRLEIRPHQEGRKSGNYSALHEGHGWGEGRFIDIGGYDIYHRHPVDPDADEMFGAHAFIGIERGEVESPVGPVPDQSLPHTGPAEFDLTHESGPVPRNNAIWAQPQPEPLSVGPIPEGDETGFSFMADLNWTGIDIDHMDYGGDLMPLFLEQAWNDWIGLWRAEEEDSSRSPLPFTPCVIIDLVAEPLELNEPCGFVLSTGGLDWFGSDFSASVLINLGGDDLYKGRVGTAGALPREARLGLPMATPSPDDGPPLPRGIGFLLDIQGDDTYATPWNRSLGYGEGGATGILFDLGGHDTFQSPDHTQGAGADRGLGVLALTQTPGAEETNHFLAHGPPAHGAGVRGGIGILTSNADNNRFQEPDGPAQIEEGDDGTPTGGLGVTAAGTGTNSPPQITQFRLPESDTPLGGGVPYTFQVDANDPNNDSMRFCWSIEHGTGTHEECSDWTTKGTHTLTYTWADIRAQENDPEPVYQVRVNVTDPLGASDEAVEVLPLMEPPVKQTGEIRGPRLLDLPGPSPLKAAYQVPVDSADIERVRAIEVDWGDGETATSEFDLRAVDWASHHFGGEIQVPTTVRLEGGEGETTRPVCTQQDEWDAVLDGDRSSAAEFRFGGISGGLVECPPVHAIIRFDGTRQVSEVEVSARVQESPWAQAPQEFLVEGLRPDGSTLPLGPIQIMPTTGMEPTTQTFAATDVSGVALAEFKGVVLRQLVPDGLLPARAIPETMYLHEVRALGPGIEKDWRLAGDHSLEYRLVSAFGAITASQAQIKIGQQTASFFTYNDLASRGAVQHASLATDVTYTLDITRIVPLEGVRSCIDWGDGSDKSCEPFEITESWQPRHRWSEPGTYDVTLVLEQEDGAGRIHHRLATVDALPVFDLQIAGDPIMFLELENEGHPTWYSGDAAYYAIVDSSGDNRYIGQVAAPRPPLNAERGGTLFENPTAVLAQAPRPGFVYDHTGDDFYVSLVEGAQGYGGFGGVGLLYDREGDDLYIAPGRAQGAAEAHGVGILIDGSGDDAYNPVPVSHPDVHASLPTNAEPLSGPTAALGGTEHGRRAALWLPANERPHLTQGAGSDGLGILFDGGGYNLFAAGSRSQGYADRMLTDWREYAFADPDCPFMAQINPAALLGGGDPVDFEQIGCIVGIQNLEIDTDPPPGGLPVGVDFESDKFQDFLSQRERPGLAGGLLLTRDGTSGYHADAHAQGSANPGGRGIFIDLDGGSTASTGQFSQGFARAGDNVAWNETLTTRLAAGSHAMILSGGVFSWRAIDTSQGTGVSEPSVQPVHDPAVALAVGPGSGTAECQWCAESPLSSLVAFGLPPPTIRWEEGSTGKTTDHEVTVTALIDPSPLGDMAGLEASLLVLPRAITVDGGCGWPVLGPSVRVPVDVDGNTVTARLDLYATLPDGPVIPSGCLELQLAAREIHGTAVGSTWGHAFGTLVAQPGPLLDSVQDEPLLTPPSPMEPLQVEAVLDQPRASAVQGDGEDPSMEWVAVPTPEGAENPCAEPESYFERLPDPVRWRDEGIRSYYKSPWTPLEEGSFTICARASWISVGIEEGWSPWKAVAEVVVDADPPQVTTDLPPFWAFGRPLPVVGSVHTGPSGLGSLEVRLVNPENPTREGQISGPVSLEDLQVRGGGTAHWEVVLEEFRPGTAGPALLQANATSGAGVQTGWKDIGTLLLDNWPPEIEDAWTYPTGTNATRMEESPVIVTLKLRDEGAGVDPESVIGVLYQAGSTPQTLRIVPGDEAGGAADDERCALDPAFPGICVHLAWEVEDPATIEQGAHQLMVHAADQVGNLMSHNPGLEFIIDRTPPLMWQSQVILPEPQTAVKPGDTFDIAFNARTQGGDPPSRLYQVEIRIGNPDGPEQTTTFYFDDPPEDDRKIHPHEDVDERYVVTVPVGDLGADHRELPLQVILRDRALNPVTHDTLVDYRGLPPEIHDFNDVRRGDALWFDWASDRPVDEVRATLDRIVEGFPEGDPVEEEVIVQDLEYLVRFSDLEPGTEYEFVIELVDAAGWVGSLARLVRTLPPVDGQIELADEPVRPQSRILDVQGSVGLDLTGEPDETIPVRVALFVIDIDDDPIEVVHEDPIAEDQLHLSPQRPTAGFTLPWDTRDFPSGTHQVVALMDDRITFRFDTWTVTTDNKPPKTGFDIDGPEARGGWYNGTVFVLPNVTDDSPPIDLETWVDGRSVDGSQPIEFSEGGVYKIEIRARDNADLPNEAEDEMTLRVDRTPPTLEADLDLPHPAVATRNVPLRISAQDDLSGVDAFRVGTNETRGPWIGEAPRNVTLPQGPDGPRWIHVDVRDMAGNERHKVLPVTLDRESPEIVMAWWSGWSPDGKPVLDFVARDTLDGPGRPAGVADIRFANPEQSPQWSRWFPTNGTGSIPIPDEHTAEEGTLIQLRDRAGNLAEPVASPSIPPPRDPAETPPPPSPERIGPPPDDLLWETEGNVPHTAHAQEVLRFTVHVRPWDGTWPDAVWLVVNDHRIAMTPDDDPSEDDSRVYHAEITATPTTLEARGDYHFVADYTGIEVRTSAQPLPTTALLGPEPEAGTQDTEDAESIPGPSVIVLLLLSIWSGFRMIQRERRPILQGRVLEEIPGREGP